MTKKTTSILLVFILIFTGLFAPDALGYQKQTDTGHRSENLSVSMFTSAEITKLFAGGTIDLFPSDLKIDKPGTVITNRFINNLHITREVGDGDIILKNVVVLGEMLIEGGGQNSIIIKNSEISRIVANKANGKLGILIEGDTSVKSALINSDTVLKQKDIAANGYKEVILEKNSSVELSMGKSVSWTSSNSRVAQVSPKGLVDSKNIGFTHIFADTSDGKKLPVCKITVTEQRTEHEKAIKILTIGNSFSNDSTYYLYDIAKSAGINLVVANLHFSGATFENHWKNASSNLKAYTYYKWSPSGAEAESGITMADAVLDEKWDYITFQQASKNSGIYSTFQPYLNNLESYVRKLATNPDVKFALNMTWAYSSGSNHENYESYGHNQLTMYTSILNAYRQASEETGIKIVIPSATSVQNARTNEALSKIGDELTSDGYHLEENMGRYIAGLTLFEELIIRDRNMDIDIFKDDIFAPLSKDSSKELIESAKKAVVKAIEIPFKITNIE